MAKMIKAKILVGEHFAGDKTYTAGDIIPSISESLVNSIPKKFQKYDSDIEDAKIIEEPKKVKSAVVEPELSKEELIASLIVDGEELNSDGLPKCFEPVKVYPEFTALPEDTVYPYKYSDRSQWHLLSNGTKVMGLQEAERGEKLIGLIYGK